MEDFPDALHLSPASTMDEFPEVVAEDGVFSCTSVCQTEIDTYIQAAFQTCERDASFPARYVDRIHEDLQWISTWVFDRVEGSNPSVGNLVAPHKEVVTSVLYYSSILGVIVTIFVIVSVFQALWGKIYGVHSNEEKYKRTCANLADSMRMLIDKQSKEVLAFSSERRGMERHIHTLQSELDRIVAAIEHSNGIDAVNVSTTLAGAGSGAGGGRVRLGSSSGDSSSSSSGHGSGYGRHLGLGPLPGGGSSLRRGSSSSSSSSSGGVPPVSPYSDSLASTIAANSTLLSSSSSSSSNNNASGGGGGGHDSSRRYNTRSAATTSPANDNTHSSKQQQQQPARKVSLWARILSVLPETDEHPVVGFMPSTTPRNKRGEK